MYVLNCNIMYVTVIGLDVSIQFNALLAAGIGPFIHLCAYYMICVIGEVISKGYRPEARGYVRPRATHEGNKSHNHELKADKRLIFT